MTNEPQQTEEANREKAIEDAVLVVAKAMERIGKSRITRKMIVALIHDESGLGKSKIELVLNNLMRLEETWLKPVKAKKGAG